MIDSSDTLHLESSVTDVHRVASRDVVSESFDGDIVVVDLRTGRYFSLSRSGGALWQMLSVGASPAAIGLAAGQDTAAIAAFAATLRGHGLLAKSTEGSGSEPDAEAVARFIGAGDTPEIDVFDDLADLFTADPIHDVEEPAGWPVVKQG